MGRQVAGSVFTRAVAFTVTALPLHADPVEWAIEAGGNGHYYELVTPPGGITWTDAKTAAEEREFQGSGGHLVAITSREEHDFLAANFPLWAAWIGLSDARSEGTFEWVTGEPLGYTRWGSNEPNDSGDEDYVSYTAQDDRWNDFRNLRTVHDTADFTYLVEYPSTSSPGRCSTEVVSYLDEDYRFLVVNSPIEGFERPDFDDSGFSTGQAAFGGNVGGLPCGLSNPQEVRTDWPTGTQLLLRKVIVLPPGVERLHVGVAVDNDVQAWVNGTDISGGLVLSENCPSRDGFVFTAPGSILETGANLLAVRGRDRDPGAISYLDPRVTADAPCTPPFRRGDANVDGDLSIVDPVNVLNSLFGPAALDCKDAADADDNGVLNVTDVIAVLGYLFLGTLPPRDPFAECGQDLRFDALDCERFPPCL